MSLDLAQGGRGPLRQDPDRHEVHPGPVLHRQSLPCHPDFERLPLYPKGKKGNVFFEIIKPFRFLFKREVFLSLKGFELEKLRDLANYWRSIMKNFF